MNDSVSKSKPPPSETIVPLNLDEANWCEKPASPISPLSFAFMTDKERVPYKFPASKGEDVVKKGRKSSKQAEPLVDPHSDGTCSTSSSTSSSSSSTDYSSVPIDEYKDDNLLILGNDVTPPKKRYVPKAHIGWASFGETLQQVKKVQVSEPSKRKVYVVRPPRKTSSNHVQASDNRKVSTTASSRPKVNGVSTEKESSDTDEDVDVVGIDDEDDTFRNSLESGRPPDLPPQRSIGSRFEAKRLKRESRRSLDSDDDDSTRWKLARNFSPPPRLEPQTKKSSVSQQSDGAKESDDENGSGEEDAARKIKISSHNPSQILKTKVCSSAIPLLPLSKSIMERKKVALEMTKNSIIRKIAPKAAFKNITFAPKSVQVPAYTDKAPMTVYSNLNKTSLNAANKDGKCGRCVDKSPVDMSSFKFIDDSTVVAVRAHLCDQTRVMIARTAMWNREYSKRLGDLANGTIWQKPDDVTAQMTGFCSATVRRCIDIANLTIVPKCADRIGVSRNDLASLKSAFGDEKFYGQAMRTPHVLTQYYNVRPGVSSATNSERSPSCSVDPPSPLVRMTGKPPTNQVDIPSKPGEEENKLLPIHRSGVHSPSSTSSPNSKTGTASSKPALPQEKRTILRWKSIQTPAVLRGVLSKKADVGNTGRATYTMPTRVLIPKPIPRKRGRPKKDKKVEKEEASPVRPTTRRLRSSRRNLYVIDEAVQETVEYLMEEVIKKCEAT